MCIYIIPGDELGNLATVIRTKKTELWTNQMKVNNSKTTLAVVKHMTSFQTNCFGFVSTLFSPITV